MLHKKNLLHNIVEIFLAVFILISMAVPVSASAEKSFDVVFVIDNSGSMLKSDPERLALKGAELFVDLLAGTNSRAGYVMFSDTIRDKRSLEIINGNTSLKNAFENTVYPEIGATDIGSALQFAQTLFDDDEKFKDNKKIIVLMTDGKPEVAGKTAEELYNSINSATNYFKDIAPVYTIGLNYDGGIDTALMQNIADTTKAFYYEVTKNTDLPDCFMKIFINLSSGKFETIGDNITNCEVKVPENIETLNLVIMPPCTVVHSLETFIETPSYILLKQANPESGTIELGFDKNVTVKLLTTEKSAESIAVTFDTDGGTEIQTMYLAKGAVLPSLSTTKTGFNFDGWLLGETKFDLSTPITSNITLKAVWTTAPVTTVPNGENPSNAGEKEGMYSINEVNIIPVIIFAVLLLAVIYFGIFLFPKLMVDKIFGTHPLLSGIMALVLNLIICLSVWIIFLNLLSPTVFSINPKKTFYDKSYSNFYEKYFFFTAILIPFIYNFICAYIVPALTSNLLKVKKMQCWIFTFSSLIGIVFPLYLWYGFAFSFATVLLYLLPYIFTYTVNFILCSLCVRFTYGKYFRFIA
ncbi:hypothetical protein FACS1894132_08610 [Clostridia bacterium]|nr:hypothetical protein FACS1894132_08610 [Clostridia bacterium]